MAGDVRLTQLARIFGLPHDNINEAAVKTAVSSRPADLGAAIFHEAVNSDDVIDEASALAYLDARLAILGDLVPTPSHAPLRAEFERLLSAWQ